MLVFVVAIALSQAGPAAPAAEESPPPAEAPPPPAWLPKAPSLGTVTPPGMEEEEPAPRPRPSDPPSLASRVLFTGLGAVAGSAAGLGLSAALTAPSPALDTTFANAMLSALLLTGVGFTVHEAMGGRGEIMLALLSSVVIMGASAAIANAIDRTVPTAPILTSVIGTLPAAALVVLSLEGTSTGRRHLRTSLAPAPHGGGLLVLAADL